MTVFGRCAKAYPAKTAAAGLMCAALLLTASAARAAGDLVYLAQGALQGRAFGRVAAFKDVPYAPPPVGALRWRPPGPPPHWKGVRQADGFGPACTQPQDPGPRALTMSEDCLTLNVWTPADHVFDARLPVMVWIHGGAFVWGSASTPFYDGAQFARGGVVLVSLNYRLGRFGFFAHPALTAADPKGPLGNYGLMDQIAALKWVKTNIAAFGGDPANVTVFGESAGAISVNDLMTSPLARGLFARAIAQSGFGRLVHPPIRGGPHSAEAVGTSVAEGLGVKGDGPAALAALRALPADALNTPPSGLLDPAIPRPMIDGVVVREAYPAAFAAGRQAPVPYLAGGNSWEASLFPDLRAHPEVVLARAGKARDALVALYGGPADLGKVAMEVTGDADVIEPDRFLALSMAKVGEPAWLYYFSYVPQGQRDTLPGAGHGAEIAYVFGNLPDKPVDFAGFALAAATPDDRRVSAAMHAYWIAFAQAGQPGKAGGVAWPRFEARRQTVLEFGPDGPAARPDFRKAELDALATVATSAAPEP